MNLDVDLAVVGSGFSGSLLAMIARRLGWSVALLERGRHPRFAIGESSTPLANLLLEELAGRYELPGVAPLAKWGSWQAAHPSVGCGLKRGFTFFHHEQGQSWQSDWAHRNQLLVAASPHDAIADTHWYRPDFDQLLVGQAEELGVKFIDELDLKQAGFTRDRAELSGWRRGTGVKLTARLVVDATGPRGFLHRTLGLPEAEFSALSRTQALYTHFRGVRRWDSLQQAEAAPPYPVDDAAVHHVFKGGWIWVLRFNNGLTSTGLAATAALAEELQLGEGQPAWRRLLERLPSVAGQFADAVPTQPFVHTSRLPFRSGLVAADRWLLLPSAAGFVDPLLSTGFPLTLLGIERVSRLMSVSMPDEPGWKEGLQDYAQQTLAELDITAELVAALYDSLDDFEVFAALTFLYFGAAMYSETVRRLGQPERMRGFLLHEHPKFGVSFRQCVRRVYGGPALSGQERTAWAAELRAALEPFNLAGLGEPERRNWYPARAADLLAAGAKLGVDRPALAALLTQCGWPSVGV
jgi:FADH2 O2-dependent halogenase